MKTQPYLDGLAADFTAFNKIPRLRREVVITEKIDGTNAQIVVDDDGDVFAGSRNRWITPDNDNFGFAGWVKKNEASLRLLGKGRHYGEWWGVGIQRGYGLTERRFSLFNTGAWLPVEGIGACHADSSVIVPCVYVVPLIWRGTFDSFDTRCAVEMLASHGSFAAPGFMDPEGIVVYHTAANKYFKQTCKHDESPKGAA